MGPASRLAETFQQMRSMRLKHRIAVVAGGAAGKAGPDFYGTVF